MEESDRTPCPEVRVGEESSLGGLKLSGAGWPLYRGGYMREQQVLGQGEEEARSSGQHPQSPASNSIIPIGPCLSFLPISYWPARPVVPLLFSLCLCQGALSCANLCLFLCTLSLLTALSPDHSGSKPPPYFLSYSPASSEYTYLLPSKHALATAMFTACHRLPILHCPSGNPSQSCQFSVSSPSGAPAGFTAHLSHCCAPV